MARINRTDVIQKAVNDLALSQSSDKIPNETLDKVQLTYSLNKKFSSFVSYGSANTTGTMSLGTPAVSVGAETYLTGITASFAKDATCDLATGSIGLSIIPAESNVATTILSFSVITLTAQNQTLSMSLPYPLKIKGGSAISFASTFSLGVLTRSLSAVGFTTSSN